VVPICPFFFASRGPLPASRTFCLILTAPNRVSSLNVLLGNGVTVAQQTLDLLV
jgi:hypothetical protein